MARARISANDLAWIIRQEMVEAKIFPVGFTFAVVSDAKLGWRLVTGRLTGKQERTRKSLKNLAKIEQKLRKRYVLTED